MQRLIGARLQMKRTPHLSFVHDKGFEHSARMSEIIADARATDPNLSPENEAEMSAEATPDSAADSAAPSTEPNP